MTKHPFKKFLIGNKVIQWESNIKVYVTMPTDWEARRHVTNVDIRFVTPLLYQSAIGKVPKKLRHFSIFPDCVLYI